MFIHLGGDEVGEKCYEESESMQTWMKENQLTSTKEVESHFRKDLFSKVAKKPIVWGYELEHLQSHYPSNAII